MRAPIRLLPPVELLRELLSYDPETGDLLWKLRPAHGRENKHFNAKLAGKRAGGLSWGRKDGTNRYIMVGFRVDGKAQQYAAHRIIYKMMTGNEPPEHLDHWDGDGLNNKWGNIRRATHGENIQNSRLRKDNKSGVKGVSWSKEQEKWRAELRCHGTHRYIGLFSSLGEAETAVNLKRAELHGEFARVR